jgi:phenylalanyl-tRNA synthetase beta chain
MKGVIESLLAGLRIQGAKFQQPGTPAPHLHPGRQALLIGPDGGAWGSLGELHPRLARALDIAQPRLILAELELAPIQVCSKEVPRVKPVPRFPAALRDIAVVVDNSISAGELREGILEAGGGLVAACRLFDLFSGQGIAPGKKSIAFALGYQAPDKTLTDKEIDQAHRKVEDHLRKRFGAQVRGKDDAPSKG